MYDNCKSLLQCTTLDNSKWQNKVFFDEDEGFLILCVVGYTPLFHGYDEVVYNTLENPVLLFKKGNLQVPDSQRRHWPHCNSSSKGIPDMLDRI